MESDAHSWILWLGVAAVVLHVMDEYSAGWVNWANFEIGPKLGIKVTERDFLVGSVGLIFIALAGAAIGWWAPGVSLAIPALFIINAVFFHMLPSARGDRLTPGTLSAVFIYLPVAVWMFWGAAEDGRIDFGTLVLAFAIGAAITAYPVALLVLKARIGWDEETVAAATAEREAERARRQAEAERRAADELAAATPPPVDEDDDPGDDPSEDETAILS